MKYRSSIRVSEQLKEKIIKEKKEKDSINQFVKNQVFGNAFISELDFFSVKKMIEEDLKNTGKKINIFAKKYNTEGVLDFDKTINKIVKKYESTLISIAEKKIVKKSNNFIPVDDLLPKNKVIDIYFSEAEKEKMEKIIKSLDIKVCDFIRSTLYYSGKIMMRDIEELADSLHHDTYRTINNLKQISYQCSISDNELSNEIYFLEQEIQLISKFEEVCIRKIRGLKNGNN